MAASRNQLHWGWSSFTWLHAICCRFLQIRGNHWGNNDGNLIRSIGQWRAGMMWGHISTTSILLWFEWWSCPPECSWRAELQASCLIGLHLPVLPFKAVEGHTICTPNVLLPKLMMAPFCVSVLACVISALSHPYTCGWSKWMTFIGPAPVKIWGKQLNNNVLKESTVFPPELYKKTFYQVNITTLCPMSKDLS